MTSELGAQIKEVASVTTRLDRVENKAAAAERDAHATIGTELADVRRRLDEKAVEAQSLMEEMGTMRKTAKLLKIDYESMKKFHEEELVKQRGGLLS